MSKYSYEHAYEDTQSYNTIRNISYLDVCRLHKHMSIVLVNEHILFQILLLPGFENFIKLNRIITSLKIIKMSFSNILKSL